MVIKILGSGCNNCKKLYEMAADAAKELGITPELLKVEGMKEIVSYGVMKTPALVVDENVKIMGRVPAYNEVLQVLKDAQ
jgi:small redox-active disulfide protein 2